MKYLKYLSYFLLVLVFLYGFKRDTITDQFQKMKTLTQIIRLVNDNYVEDVDMNDILEGAIIGLLGSISGIVFSLLLLIMQKMYHFIRLPNDIYFMDYLPVKISPVYFIVYPCFTLIITIFISYLPAKKAAKISPSEALRYE